MTGALLGLLHGEHRTGHLVEDVRTHFLTAVAHDGSTVRGSTAHAAESTCPIIVRPQIGWRTLLVFDFIRVPLPAARTMTAAGRWAWFTCSPARLCSRSLPG